MKTVFSKRIWTAVLALTLIFSGFPILQGQSAYGAEDTTARLSVSVPGGAGGTLSLYKNNGGSYWSDYYYDEELGDISFGSVTVGTDGWANFAGADFPAGTYTLRYSNTSANNTIPTQFWGGYVGDDNGNKAIKGFALAATGHVKQTFNLVKPAVMKVKVTPVGANISTSAQAYHLKKNTNGAWGYEYLNSVNSNNTAGVFYFPVQNGQKYMVRGSGYSYVGGNTEYYETKWYGGLTGYSEPRNETKTITGKASGIIDIGTIALSKATGKIQGTAGGSDEVYASNIETGASRWGETQKNAQGKYTYVLKNLSAGVYVVRYNGNVQVVKVAAGKTVTANMGAPKESVDLGSTNTHISGAKQKGKKLAASATTRNAGLGVIPTYKYVWTDGSTILSSKSTYKVGASQANRNLYVVTIMTAYGYSGYSITGAPGNSLIKLTASVKVSGTYKVGKKLKAKAKGIRNSTLITGAVKYKYQWYRNGKPIKKAKKATYKLTKKDKKKKINVVVTVTSAGCTPQVVASKAKKVK